MTAADCVLLHDTFARTVAAHGVVAAVARVERVAIERAPERSPDEPELRAIEAVQIGAVTDLPDRRDVVAADELRL